MFLLIGSFYQRTYRLCSRYFSISYKNYDSLHFNIVKARVKTYNNMAQAQMKLTAWDSAFASIRQVSLSHQFAVQALHSWLPGSMINLL